MKNEHEIRTPTMHKKAEELLPSVHPGDVLLYDLETGRRDRASAYEQITAYAA